jgi:hypothetical protein
MTADAISLARADILAALDRVPSRLAAEAPDAPKGLMPATSI